MGKNVVVVGAGLHGLEVAEYLAKRGRKVTVVEPTERHRRGRHRLPAGPDHGLVPHQGRARSSPAPKNIEVTDKGLSFDDNDGKHVELEADTVMPTAPLKPNDKLYRSLEGKVPELYLIGDAKESGMIVHAVRAGFQTAKAL